MPSFNDMPRQHMNPNLEEKDEYSIMIDGRQDIGGGFGDADDLPFEGDS